MEAKFAGAFNLRFTAPSEAFLASCAQRHRDDSELVCHLEIFVMKELAANPFVWDPPHVHSGHHNMENYSEVFLRKFDEIARRMGARAHLGQLNRLSFNDTEIAFGENAQRWRLARTLMDGAGADWCFSNSFTRRTGLDSGSNSLAACSWGRDRYDILSYNAAGDLQHLNWEGAWRREPGGVLRSGFPSGLRFTGPLTTVSWGPGRIDLFGVGAQPCGRPVLLQVYWADGWNWVNLAAVRPGVFGVGDQLLGPIAVTSRESETLDLFAMGAGDQIIHYRYTLAGDWERRLIDRPFAGMGERFAGSITACSWGPNRLDVFGIGSQNQVLQLWREGGPDDPWQTEDLRRILPDANFRGPLTSICSGPGRIDIFGIDPHGGLSRYYWRGVGWGSQPISASTSSFVTRYGLTSDFGLESDDDRAYLWQHLSTPDRFVNRISAASWGPGRLDVFGFGFSNSLLQVFSDNDGDTWAAADLGHSWTWHTNAPISSLQFEIRIGFDGLRANDFDGRGKLEAFVRFAGGAEFSVDVNRRQGMAEWSRHNVRLDVQGSLTLDSAEEFGLRYESVQGSFTTHPVYACDFGTSNSRKGRRFRTTTVRPFGRRRRAWITARFPWKWYVVAPSVRDRSISFGFPWGIMGNPGQQTFPKWLRETG